jgi:transcriptional regulator with XRE-family HTH domain
VKRNRGAVALARTGLTQEAIGEKVHRAQQTVARWLTEQRKPEASDRALLHDHFNIDPSWWDLPIDDRQDDDSGATIDRYTRAAARVWSLFDSDPLGPDSKAESYIDRLEALLDRGLLASTATSTREVPSMAQLEERVRRQAEKHITLIETDPDTLPLEKVRVLEKLWNIVKPNASDAKLSKSKQWIELREKLVEVVMKFPDAREAILQAVDAAEEL